MKTPLASEQLRDDGPDRLQIRSGGGCLSIFGIPFFAAGLFVCLIGVGVVPLENADDVDWWAWPVMLAMGLVFVAVGGWLVFGRSWISIDRSRGTVARERGLLVPLTREELSLQNYTGVELRFDAGDSDTPDRYPIVLRAQPGAKDLTLLSGPTYADALAKAERIASFLRFDLTDTTTDHESVHRPGREPATFQERVRDERQASVPQPVTMRSELEPSAHGIRLTIPGPGLKPSHLVQLAIPLGIAAYLLAQFLPLNGPTGAPEPVMWIFLAFGSLLVLAPMIRAVASILRATRSRTVVSASPAGITIEERRAVRSDVTEIPADEILDIDCSTSASTMESARRGMAKSRAPGFGGGDAGTTGSFEIPRWVRHLIALMPSRGVILKTRKGVYTFGAGLPDEEIVYLHGRVRQAVLS